MRDQNSRLQPQYTLVHLSYPGAFKIVGYSIIPVQRIPTVCITFLNESVL